MMRLFHQQGQVKCPPPGHRTGPFYPNMSATDFQSFLEIGTGAQNRTIFDAQCQFANANTEEITDARPERSFCAENYLSGSPDSLTLKRGEITVDYALNDGLGAFWWIHIMSRKDWSNQFGEACPFPLVSTLHKEIYLARTAKPSVDLSALDHYIDVSDDEDYWDSCGVCDIGHNNTCVNNQMSFDPAIDAGRNHIQTPASNANVSYVPPTPDPYSNDSSSRYELDDNQPTEAAGAQQHGHQDGNAGGDHSHEGSHVSDDREGHRAGASEEESGTDASSHYQGTKDNGERSRGAANKGTGDRHHVGYLRCIRK